MIMKLWALWALAGTASALLPVIVPMSDNANDTQLTWGPVTADISANRCRAFGRRRGQQPSATCVEINP